MGQPQPKADVTRAQVLQAFNAWLKTNGDQLDGEAHALAADALQEIVELRTPLFDEWYVRNHYRYRRLKEVERRRSRALCRLFVALVSLGKVAI